MESLFRFFFFRFLLFILIVELVELESSPFPKLLLNFFKACLIFEIFLLLFLEDFLLVLLFLLDISVEDSLLERLCFEELDSPGTGSGCLDDVLFIVCCV